MGLSAKRGKLVFFDRSIFEYTRRERAGKKGGVRQRKRRTEGEYVCVCVCVLMYIYEAEVCAWLLGVLLRF
jgi:hypothetical protein